MSDLYCKGRVYVDSRMGYAPCSKSPTRDGFCSIHHPDAVAKRKARSDAEYAERARAERAKWAARYERERRADCFDDLMAALKWARDETDRFQSDGRIDWTEFYNHLSEAIDRAGGKP